LEEIMKPEAKGKKSKTSGQATKGIESSDALQRVTNIATAAYFKAEERGFAPGGELDDWLAAETEFDVPGTNRR
jgi:hypothetical protein